MMPDSFVEVASEPFASDTNADIGHWKVINLLLRLVPVVFLPLPSGEAIHINIQLRHGSQLRIGYVVVLVGLDPSTPEWSSVMFNLSGDQSDNVYVVGLSPSFTVRKQRHFHSADCRLAVTVPSKPSPDGYFMVEAVFT